MAQRPAGRIVVGAQVAARLVDQPVDVAFGVERLRRRRRPAGPGSTRRAQFAHHLAVHADAAGEDQFVAVAPRADAGVGQIFVEAFHELIHELIVEALMGYRKIRRRPPSKRQALGDRLVPGQKRV